MTTYFETVLSQIFDRSAEARLSLDEERAAIAAAKDGDESATVALLYAYAPTLRSAAARHRETLGEDARQVAVVGLLEAVRAFDFEKTYDRLAAIVWEYVTDALLGAAGSTLAVPVPPRTLKRFFGVLRRANGDVAAAALIAPDHDLSREAFYAILGAVRVESLEVGQDEDRGDRGPTPEPEYVPLWDNATAIEVEDRLLVEAAFDAVDPEEEEVCRYAYGFVSGEALSDAGVVHAVSVRDLGADAVAEGQTILSRATVQRSRVSALGKMREALAVDLD